jgi:hypothetical protein
MSMVLSESSLGLLPPAFVVIADNIQAQTDRFCLLDPVPTGSGPFFYRLGVKQRRAKTPAQAALLIGYWLRQPLHVITFICEGGPEHPKASGSSRPLEYCTRPC